jgi:hypothetical protein
MTTSSSSPRRSAWARLAPAPVGWPTVVVLAALLAYADGFVLTSIQGAVGAIERAQHPFAFWLRTSTLMLPVFLLSVLVALAVARRLVGPVLRSAGKVVVAALLIVLAGSAVGSAAMVVSAAYDYQLQSAQGQQGMVMDAPADPSTCTGMCAAQQAQFDLDQRAARLGSALVLGTHLVAVGWVLAFRGGGLERTRPRGSRRPAAEGLVRTGWVSGPQGSPSR